GLGTLGTDSNALGITLSGAGKATADLGGGVSALGSGVAAFGASSQIEQVPLVGGVLSKTGQVVDGVGQRVTMLGNTLSAATTSGPLGNLTQQVGDRLVPVVAMVESTTDKLGTATGLGAPVSGVLQQV
ncbi:collagen-like triple helix repeat-containing protein, partial [Pandoraea sputorum]|uniref:collagen-like triple helix repeat-containing protein n=2 Tax=Pseudomonadota TaxID=1224 RepID=UPI003558C3A8